MFDKIRAQGLRCLVFISVFMLSVPDMAAWAKMLVCDPSGAAAAESPQGLSENGYNLVEIQGNDELEEFNRIYMERGWGDGLPLVPPTPERVNAMLAGYDLPADFSIAILPPLDGNATMWNIAVNAVMAGCEPKHLPVLVAAVEAASDPALDLRGISTTTNPDSLLIIVSGPIVEQLGLNAGAGSFGRGNRGNAAISRALHLIIQNVGGSRVGKTDMSTLGQPGEFVMFLAENVSASPWLTFHKDRGFLPHRNVVTIAGVEGYSGIMGIGYSREQFLGLIASWLRGHDRPWRPWFICIIAQDTAAMLARDGWDRDRIKRFIREKARIPYFEWEWQYGGVRSALSGVPAEVYEPRKDNELVPKPFYDDMLIIVAGGKGEKSMIMPCWAGGKIISQEIRLPAVAKAQ